MSRARAGRPPRGPGYDAAMLPLPAWIAILKGPRCPSSTTARDLLLEHLAWARRAGPAPAPAPEEDEAAEELAGAEPDGACGGCGIATPCCWPPAGDAEAGEPPGPEALREAVTAAAVELSQAWRDDVLAGIPSRFVFGLCALADRGAYLLEEAAPELSAGFARLRELFVGHSQGGARRSEEELLAALDELEALADATVRRALELNGQPVE